MRTYSNIYQQCKAITSLKLRQALQQRAFYNIPDTTSKIYQIRYRHGTTYVFTGLMGWVGCLT